MEQSSRRFEEISAYHIVVKRQKPNNVTNEEWEAINKAIQIISEHFSNTGLFINWVDEEGETQHCEIFDGNGFALENHIEKWVDGDFLPDEFDDDDDDEKPKKAKV